MDHGYEGVIDPAWDDVRSAVLEGGYAGYVALPTSMAPGTGPLELRYWIGDPRQSGFRLAVDLNVYGLRLITVLGHTLPTGVIPGQAQILAFPFQGRYGGDLRIEVEVEYGSRETLLWDDPRLPDFVRS